MYLKNLTALGFKSFADRTSLNFQPGITSIVGPNGCGKSNVADAIRWVLGEQSAKALRGGEMADVIFNGTDSRKPMSMAEVSLTVGGIEEENLSAAGVELDYHEVTLTRRVYRDGGSDYFINKTACRLRDIQRLFMGTGVGRTSYSIMAQGNITQILSSKPEDRRMIFEEAAGITKFKTQKREALKKLENTDQNLLRVEDLIREVKRQIGSLQRQAGKARRYKALMQELQYLECQLARHQYDLIQGKIQQLKESLEEALNGIEIASNEVLAGENEVTRLREQLGEIEKYLSESQQKGLELKSQIEQQEHKIQFNERRISELVQQNEKAIRDIEQAEERKSLAAGELEGIRNRLQEAEQSLAIEREKVIQKQGELADIESSMKGRVEKRKQLQSAAFSLDQKLSAARNQINALDIQRQGNQARLEKLSSEKIQLEEERTQLRSKIETFSADVQAQRQDAVERRGTVEERKKLLQVLQSNLALAVSELDNLLRKQSEITSRLQVLEQLQAGYEGFSSGALAVMKNAEGIKGSLADRIQVPDVYIQATETALGQNLQLALAENPQTARDIIARLRDEKKGQASIVPLGWLTQVGGLGRPDSESFKPEGMICLSSVVKADPEVRDLIDCLLGDTFIAPDLQTAARCWEDRPGQVSFVTPEGDMLNRYGVFAGGSSKQGQGKTPGSILGRKNQIEELKVQLRHLQDQVGVASEKKSQLQSEQASLQAGLQEAQSQLNHQEVTIAATEGEFRALEGSLKGVDQKVSTVVYEIQRLSDQESEGQSKRDNYANQLVDLEQAKEVSEKELEEVNQALEEIAVQRDEAYQALTEKRVTLATQEQVVQSLQRQITPLEQRIEEMTHLAEIRRIEIDEFIQKKNQSESECEVSRHEIEMLSKEREQVSLRLIDLNAQKKAIEESVATQESNLKRQRHNLNEFQTKRSQLDLELAENQMETKTLTERIRDKFHVELDEIRSECIKITFADASGPAKVETLSPEEMNQQGVATDWVHVGEQVKSLQDKLDGIGPVNLVAIEEYEETEERYQFLTEQHDDLVKAKEQLLEVINKINTQTREMFKETFDKVRENFQTLFTEIFGGGKADLLLLDEDNVLESGIDIKARPPGKQLQGISLLSGGEQTMTAVALLFAIYQVKPSPFCILDELDAPLDESNINRFIGILQRFLGHSQFIIITHNKRTISIADVLYGVTMQERGVSRIVSVKFHKADDGEDESKSEEPAAVAG